MFGVYMLFKVALLGKLTIADGAWKRLGVDMLSKMISDITTFFENDVAILI